MMNIYNNFFVVTFFYFLFIVAEIPIALHV